MLRIRLWTRSWYPAPQPRHQAASSPPSTPSPAPSSPLCRSAFEGWKAIPGGVVPYCLSARRPEWLQTRPWTAQTPSLDLIVERTRPRPGGPAGHNGGAGKASPGCMCAFFLLKGRLREAMEPRGGRHGGKEVTRHLYFIWWSFRRSFVGNYVARRTQA